MMSERVVLSQVSKNFGAFKALDDVDITLHTGEHLAILGPSGSGKSTLLKIIAGFESIDSGTVSLRGKTVSTPQHTLVPEKRRIGLVFQEFALFPHLTVSQNIAFGLKKGSDATKRVAELLELIGLRDSADKPPYLLSGGEQQRVAIARAMGPKPDVILLDEAFGSLDLQLRNQLRTEVKEVFRQEGISALLITHDQMEAFDFADRIVVMKEGRVQQKGTAHELYHHPVNPWVARFMGQSCFLKVSYAEGSVTSALGNHPYDGAPFSGIGKMLVRPESVRLCLHHSGLPQGVLESIQFQGPIQHLTLRLPSQECLQATVSSKSQWKLQQSVGIDLKEFRVFSDDF